jgi:hypothetical protein
MKAPVSNSSKASAPATALTAEQEALLAEVQRVLGALTTPALIYEAARIRLSIPPTEADKTQFRNHYGYAVAAVKVMAYVHMMREANKERVRIGRAIDKMDQKSRQLALIDPMGAIAPSVEAPMMAGLQELELHKFAIAVNRIRILLPHALKAAGFSLNKADRDTLEEFEELRHFYEHIENHLPGKPNPGPSVAEEGDDTYWRIIFQLPLDTTGQISFNGKTIQVDSRGATRVQTLVKRAWWRMAPSIIAETEKYLRKHPHRIPDPRTVDSGWEVKIGGALALRNSYRPGDEGLDWELVNGVLVPVPI